MSTLLDGDTWSFERLIAVAQAVDAEMVRLQRERPCGIMLTEAETAVTRLAIAKAIADWQTSAAARCDEPPAFDEVQRVQSITLWRQACELVGQSRTFAEVTLAALEMLVSELRGDREALWAVDESRPG